MRWVMSFLVFGLVGLIVTRFYENKIFYRHFSNKILYIKDYHVHHSMVGLMLILVASMFLVQNKASTAKVISSLGVGLITQHTISEKKFVFVSNKHKERRHKVKMTTKKN